jgi:hypothetical protein
MRGRATLMAGALLWSGVVHGAMAAPLVTIDLSATLGGPAAELSETYQTVCSYPVLFLAAGASVRLEHVGLGLWAGVIPNSAALYPGGGVRLTLGGPRVAAVLNVGMPPSVGIQLFNAMIAVYPGFLARLVNVYQGIGIPTEWHVTLGYSIPVRVRR